ncbi:hypothetical protein [Planomicrobium okeanokoites]|nr:hypothetical protein [Planomicrobium okeanokoites]
MGFLKKSGNSRSALTGKRWIKWNLSHLFATKQRSDAGAIRF